MGDSNEKMRGEGGGAYPLLDVQYLFFGELPIAQGTAGGEGGCCGKRWVGGWVGGWMDGFFRELSITQITASGKGSCVVEEVRWVGGLSR